ncbi:MAG TPA: DUF4340 domain-containing protein [Steroidobacteraceae bacterium]
MTRQRFIVLMVAALVAISAALYLSTQRNLPRDPRGSAFLPSLASEVNTVTSLSVLKGSTTPTVTVRKQGEQWTVAERGDYPADVPKLRKLLLALSDAKVREEKTSNPENYAIIGVEDPSLAGATGAQIELVAQDGKHGVIVGKTAGGGNFVRRAAAKTSYIVEPGISFEAEPRYWIDTRLLDIPTDKIQSIDTKPAAGPGYSVRRVPADVGKPADAKPGNAAPAATKFVLDAVPSGRQAADSQSLAPSPTAFSSLAADDVAAAGGIDFSKPSTVTITLTDASVITLTGAAVGDKRWIQVAAPKDASLSAKTGGRAFEISGYRYDGMFRPLEQLLVPKPPPPSAKAPPPSARKPAPP